MKNKKGRRLRLAGSVIVLMGLIASCAYKAEGNAPGQPESAHPAELLSPSMQEASSMENLLVDSIDLRGSAILIQSDPGYTSTQGMCVIEDRYIAVARYKSDGAKDLMIYDLIEKKVKASNCFQLLDPMGPSSGTNVNLEHLNCLACVDGYLYVSRPTEYKDVLRLKVRDDGTVVYDSVAYAAPDGEPRPVDLTGRNGEFYWMALGGKNGKYYVYHTTDFTDTELAFASDFGGLLKEEAIAKQGMAFDGNYLYFAFSGRLDAPMIESGIDLQKLMRNTEKILITRTDGTIVRALSFSRGSYGEIEDIDTITIDGNTYLLISCNRNDDNVACVYAVPLYRNTVPSYYLEPSQVDGSLYYDRRDFAVYCDNTVCYTDGVYDPLCARPFASGLPQDPFSDVYAALNQIKRFGCPAVLHVTGVYGDLFFRNLPAGITFSLEDASIASLRFEQCPGVTISGNGNAVLGQIKAVKSVVLAASGIGLNAAAAGSENAIEAVNSVFVGALDGISGYSAPVTERQSLVSISTAAGETFGAAGARPSDVEMLLRQYGITGSTDDIVMTRYLGRENQHTVVRQGNSIMLSMTLGDGTRLEEATGNDLAGTLPAEYCPATEILVPAIAAENEDGSGATALCSLRILSNGEIIVVGDPELIKSACYILASVNYLLA